MNTILDKVENMMSEQMKFISEAITLGNKERKATCEETLKTLKLIKAELVKANNSKDYTLDEKQEINTLIKMVEQREKSIKEYKNGNRNDLADIEQEEINLIFKIVPQVEEYFNSLPKETDIENYTKETINNYIATKDENYKLSMRDMGIIIKTVKEKYNNADGNIIRKTFQEYL